MKVELITRHAIANYGSLLQTIATQNVIKNLGYECEVIDFVRKDEYHLNSTLTIAKNKKRIKANPFLYFLYLLVRIPENIIVNGKFEKMRNRYLKMTKSYHSIEELHSNKPMADVYMTGSDQVWGPVLYGGYEWAYFLDFCNTDDTRVAYGASFGKTEIENSDKEKMIKSIQKYKRVVVRENQAVKMLEKWGIKSEQALDPTLLMNKEEWGNLILMKNKCKYEKYILVYQIHNDKKLSVYAEKFAKKAKLPLMRISSMIHQASKSGKFVPVPDLGEFLSYINNASFVITDSFHGTAFSINFNVPFVTLLPETGTSSRNLSLLELTGLTSQIIKNEEDFTFIEKRINFKNANRILEKERKKSKVLLDSIIGGK